MNDGSDGRHTGPVGDRAGRPGTAPVPRRLPPDPPDTAGGADGQHRTEQVPFPLPAPGSVSEHRTAQVPFPLPPLPSPNAPAAVPGPETGPLYLAGYPPRVPGAARRFAAAPEPEDVAAPGRDEQDADDDR